MNKISIQTGGMIDSLGIDEGLAAIKNAGFDCIDFGLDTFHKWDDIAKGIECETFANEDNLWAYVNEVKTAADKYGLTFGQMHAPFPSYVTQSAKGSANVQNDIRKTIEVCGYLGCRYLVTHPIFDGSARYPVLTKKTEHELNMEFYSSLIPLLKKHNVVCCLENIWTLDYKAKKVYTAACSEINEAAAYIDDLNAIAGEKCFGFCLDLGHLMILGQQPEFWVRRLGERIVTLHIHDNDGVGDDHALPYTGVLNCERFIEALAQIGYTGTLNFETHGYHRRFPKELIPSALKMIADMGKYFVSEISNSEK